jgi:hypothetical protein
MADADRALEIVTAVAQLAYEHGELQRRLAIVEKANVELQRRLDVALENKIRVINKEAEA